MENSIIATEVIDTYDANSFGALLSQSALNLKAINGLLDSMQDTLMEQFRDAEVDEQVAIFKAIISRGKYEAQVHSSLVNAINRNEQLARFFKELLNATSNSAFEQAPLKPELKTIVDVLKGSIRDDIQHK